MDTIVFVFVGLIVGLGFAGNYLFRRVGVPDILLLVLVGFLLGPVFHLVQPEQIAPVAPLFSSLTLVTIVLDGALSLNLYKVLGESGKALLLAVLGVAASVVATVLVAHLLFNWTYLEGVLLGVMVGGTTASIVIALVSQMHAPERAVTLLTLESTFTDAIVIVISITLLQMLVTTGDQNPISVAGKGIASAVSVGAVIGGIAGIVWVRVLTIIKAERYNDILTLSVALFFYAVVENLGGNGAIFVLTFGLVLANGTEFTRMLRMKEAVEVPDVMRSFMAQVSFFMRTFFFVYLGLIIVTTNYQAWVFGLVLSLALVFGRLVAVWVTSIGDPFLRRNMPLITAMLPRGLAAAVVAQIVAASQLARAKEFPDVITAVIICTVLATALLTSAIKARLSRTEPAKTSDVAPA